ncbi:hypothetical protein KDW46_04280 [Burkholderia vietnamiensis]|nr:hypothetical protein [Burkholderia vietnamiensis]
MKLSEILSDALGVLDLLKPHTRDDGDQYHAQLTNNLTAAHGAALEAEAAAKPSTGDLADELNVPPALVAGFERALTAIETIGAELGDIKEIAHDLRAAFAAPAASTAPATQQPAA